MRRSEMIEILYKEDGNLDKLQIESILDILEKHGCLPYDCTCFHDDQFCPKCRPEYFNWEEK